MSAEVGRRARSAARQQGERSPAKHSEVHRQIYLVPGFFGFSRLGGLNYFQGVADALREALAQHRIDAEILECRTKPTASIRRRASRLLDEVRGGGGLEADELYFIGHSTGGLDARLATTPGVRLRPDTLELRIEERTRSVITVATPHFGTPLASFFTTILGRQLLELLAALATSRGGRAGLIGSAQLIGLLARAEELAGREGTFLAFLTRTVLDRATDAGDDLWTYLREMGSDQGALVQLMPEAMHLFNASVTEDEAIHYGSLLTIAPPPPAAYGGDNPLSLGRAALASAFSFLYALTAREHRQYPYPDPAEEISLRHRSDVPLPLDAGSNDGIVPTLSQIHGHVIDLVVADHLDIVGQFDREDLRHGDWLPSGSHFDRSRFERAWGAVAAEIAKVAAD